MEFASNIFEIVQEEDTAVIAPKRNLSDLDHEVESEFRLIAEEFRRRPGTNIIIDCGKTQLFDCAAIGLFVRLSRMTRKQGRRFALCCLSPFELEILEAANLDSLWPICSTRTEAIEAVKTPR
jgi:anti-anti-sigma factor